MNNKIFVVDDDENIRELVKLYLEKEGFNVIDFPGGREMLEMFQASAPDLVMLDVMMPGMDGYEALRELRKVSEVPVIMATAKGETFDKVLGLELGADDYLVKPFDPKEMVARVKAVIRRFSKAEKAQTNVLTIPELTIDMDDYNVIYHGKTMELPPKELELLNYLVSNPNRVFTREQLLDQIWGYDYYGETRTVDVHIKRLREKFKDEDQWEIKTVWGVGYKFRLD